MDTDMKRLEMLIADLNEMGIKPFVGYGNPNADILIIGKECADENEDRQEKFYTHNFEQWEESLKGHGFGYKCGGEPYDFESGNFHPINPFYKLEKKKQTGKRETGRAPSASRRGLGWRGSGLLAVCIHQHRPSDTPNRHPCASRLQRKHHR